MKLSISPVVCAVFALGGGCAPKPATQTPVTIQPEQPAAVNTWTPQGPVEPWWQAGDAACPDGARLVGAPPPQGQAYQCVLPNGEAHGPSTEWFPNGHQGTYAEYHRGVLHGRWMHWLHNHRMIEGRYLEGRKHGKWLHWFDAATDFDMQARAKLTQPLVIETYNRGLRLNTNPVGRDDPDTRPAVTTPETGE